MDIQSQISCILTTVGSAFSFASNGNHLFALSFGDLHVYLANGSRFGWHLMVDPCWIVGMLNVMVLTRSECQRNPNFTQASVILF